MIDAPDLGAAQQFEYSERGSTTVLTIPPLLNASFLKGIGIGALALGAGRVRSSAKEVISASPRMKRIFDAFFLYAAILIVVLLILSRILLGSEGGRQKMKEMLDRNLVSGDYGECLAHCHTLS